MAQATRTSAGSAGLSDDPLENATDWVNLNRKPITIGLSIVAAVVVLILGYRWMDNSKRADASTALYKAAAPLQQGRAADAEAALEGVVKRYGSTSSGQQAALMLAGVRYDKGQFAAGVKGLEAARGSASDDFVPSFEQLIAMGYQAQGQHDKAAEHFGNAASAAKFPADKGQYQAAQAREFSAAGKQSEAKAIWEALSKQADPQFNTEAQIRLGEIAGAGK